MAVANQRRHFFHIIFVIACFSSTFPFSIQLDFPWPGMCCIYYETRDPGREYWIEWRRNHEPHKRVLVLEEKYQIIIIILNLRLKCVYKCHYKKKNPLHVSAYEFLLIYFYCICFFASVSFWNILSNFM